MKKYYSLIFILLFVVGNSALAAKPENPGKPEKPAKPAKVSLCHNGETFNEETGLDEPLSFVITVSEKAVNKHINNHLDCASIFADLGEGEECELQDDGITVICEEVTLCECIEDPAELPET